MKGDRLIARFVEAAMEVDILEAQVKAFPELKESRVHRENLNAARVARAQARGNLPGGLNARASLALGQAKAARIAAARTEDPDETSSAVGQ